MDFDGLLGPKQITCLSFKFPKREQNNTLGAQEAPKRLKHNTFGALEARIR